MGIELKVLRSMNDLDVHYLPHGITTLHIGVYNNDDYGHKFRVRPENMSSEDHYYLAYELTKNNRESRSKDLKIIWGAGMTKGYELNLKPYASDSLFYHIIHDSKDLSIYSIKLVSIELVENRVEKRLMVTKTINLVPPEGCDDAVRLKVDYIDYRRKAEFQGTIIPDYKSRWFGDDLYSLKNRTSPPFILEYNGEGDFILGDVTIGIRTPIGVQPLALISGDLNRAMLHADLFYFFDNYYVVRIWCYWINDYFGEGITGETTDIGENDVELGYITQRNVEVPDIERFDLLFDVKTNKVVYIGTDLHWRETWWCTTEHPVRLRFAKHETFPLLFSKIPEVFQNMFRQKRTDYDPANDLKQTLERSQKPSAISLETETSRYQDSQDTSLAPGFYRKHVPYLVNSDFLPEYYSHPVTGIDTK
jgi:hypothetical protein